MAYAEPSTVAKRVTAQRGPQDLDRVRMEVVELRRIVERLHQLSARFKDLHRRGTEALKSHDFHTLSDVIGLERALIQRQSALVQRSRRIFQRRIAHVPRWRHAPRTRDLTSPKQ